MLLLLLNAALAKSWCAAELVVHEWGVAVFPASQGELPSHFHTQGPTEARELPSVLHLPPDTGERAKPVVSFHVAHPEYAREIPLALSVGFTQGRPKAWYPQVDQLRSSRLSSGTLVEAEALREARAARTLPAIQAATWADEALPEVGHEPTHQLIWDPLTLSREPHNSLPWTAEPWVQDQREVPGLYVNRGEESERFLFYEGLISEEPSVVLRDGELVNVGDWPVHELLYVLPDGRWMPVGTLEPGASVPLDPIESEGDLSPRRWLLDQLSLPVYSRPETGGFGLGRECVMTRDPAIPVTSASDHRLYRGEVGVLLGAWDQELFHSDQPVLVYREDAEQLAALAPISVYTSMSWYVTLRRLSLVISAPGA